MTIDEVQPELTPKQLLWLKTRGGRGRQDVFQGKVMMGDGNGGVYHVPVPPDADLDTWEDGDGFARTGYQDHLYRMSTH